LEPVMRDVRRQVQLARDQAAGPDRRG
jgi:hypothetical protein